MTYDTATSTVTLTTFFEGMTDGKTYNVVLDGVTKQFVASDGKIDHLGVTPTEIVVATETPIRAVFCDVNGVILKEQAYAGGSTVSNLDFTITTGNQGYTTETGLHLYEVGNTATVSLELHSNKIDENGNEVDNIKGTATIKAVAATTVTDNSFSIKIGNTGSNYDNVKETVVAKGDEGKSAYIQIKQSNGKPSTDLSKYTLESSDLNVLILNKTEGEGFVNGEVPLKPVLAGNCYIIIRDAKDNVIATLPVTVKPERYPATLTLSQYSAILSNKVVNVSSVTGTKGNATETSTPTDDAVNITATVMDQYQENMNKTSGFTYNNKTLDGQTEEDVFTDATDGSSTIKLTATACIKNADGSCVPTFKKGTYAGIVSYSDGTVTLKKAFTTTVQEPGDQVDSYRMILDKSSVDAVITAAATSDTTVIASVVGFDGGIKRKIYTDSVLATDWVLKAGSTAVDKDATGTTIDKTIAVNDISEGNRMAAKGYNFEATFLCGDRDVFEGIKKTVYGNFTVSDSQVAPEVKLYNDGKLDNMADLGNIMDPKYTGGTCDIGAIKTNDKNITSTSDLWNAVSTQGKSIMLYTVDVTTTFNTANSKGQYNKFNSTVTMNHTVSKAGNW